MKIGDDGWFLVPGVQHSDGREGAVIIVPCKSGYAATFMGKEDLLRMYHSLGDEIMRQRHQEMQQKEKPTTDSQIRWTDNHIE